MSGKAFIDTNVLLYSSDKTEPEKCAAALGLLRPLIAEQDAYISYQVIHEFVNVILRRGVLQVSEDTILLSVQSLLSDFHLVAFSEGVVTTALATRKRLHFAWYDCLVVAAALSAKCETLYTEDLQHGQRIDGMQIVNPFLQTLH